MVDVVVLLTVSRPERTLQEDAATKIAALLGGTR
jgi:hypothetical protein